MHKIAHTEAENRLAELIEEAASGEEVIITRGDGASFKLVPLLRQQAHPVFGSAKGLVELSDDFDAPIEGFEEYAP